MGFMQT